MAPIKKTSHHSNKAAVSHSSKSAKARTAQDKNHRAHCPVVGCNQEYNHRSMQFHVQRKHPTDQYEAIYGRPPPARHPCAYPGCPSTFTRSTEVKDHMSKAHNVDTPDMFLSVTKLKRKNLGTLVGKLAAEAGELNTLKARIQAALQLRGRKCPPSVVGVFPTTLEEVMDGVDNPVAQTKQEAVAKCLVEVREQMQDGYKVKHGGGACDFVEGTLQEIANALDNM